MFSFLWRSTGSGHEGFSIAGCALSVVTPRRSCTWNLLGPGVQPKSPALASAFLATGPPGESRPSFDVRGSPVLSREEQPGCLLLLSWRLGVPCLGGLPFWVSGGARCPPTVLLLRSQSSRLSSYHILLSFGACCAVPSFYSCV